MIVQKKLNHFEQVQVCIGFIDKECTFGDDCWFRHASSPIKTWQEYKCNSCGEKFKLKSAMMKHRKTNHIDSVQICKNDKTCQYRSQSCWFKHTYNINGNMERISKSGNDIEHIENKSEVIQKLVEMVEFSNWITTGSLVGTVFLLFLIIFDM